MIQQQQYIVCTIDITEVSLCGNPSSDDIIYSWCMPWYTHLCCVSVFSFVDISHMSKTRGCSRVRKFIKSKDDGGLAGLNVSLLMG